MTFHCKVQRTAIEEGCLIVDADTPEDALKIAASDAPEACFGVIEETFAVESVIEE